MAFRLLDTVATSLSGIWAMLGLFGLFVRTFRKQAKSWMRSWFFELRPFYLPAVTYHTIHEAMTGDVHPYWAFALNTGCSYAAWYFYKNIFGDDDRWKKRRTKVVESVKQKGSKLVVVPAGTPS